MVIALNAGSNPNEQSPSIGVYGDGNVTENSLLGNFGELLTLISADAENAVHEKNQTPQITAKQTSEALLAFAEHGNEDAKLAISNILQKVATENKNQLEPILEGGIKTSSFLEAKIENKLQHQDLSKPIKVIELLSLADLKAFGKSFEPIDAESPIQRQFNENIEITAPSDVMTAESLPNQHYVNKKPVIYPASELIGNSVVSLASELIGNSVVSLASELIGNSVVSPASELIGNPVVSPASQLIGNPVVSPASELIGNSVVSPASEFIGNFVISPTSELIGNAHNIKTPALSSSAAVKPNVTDITGAISTIGQIQNPDTSTEQPLTKKDQLKLDVVKNILQVNSASLDVGETGPSEVIFDLRDLKEALVQKFSLPLQNVKYVTVPSELIIPYTLPLNVANKPAENLVAGIDEKKFDILEVTKITLDSNLIELPLPDESNLIENVHTEQKSFTVKGGELLLTASTSLERNLVIGIAIPKNSKVVALPDFVKIQINLADADISADTTSSNLNTNKEYLTSKFIELPKGTSNDNTAERVIKNMQVLLTAMGEKSNDPVEDTYIVSVNKLSKFSQPILPNLESKELVASVNNFTNRLPSMPSNMIEKSTAPEYLDPKAQLNGPDRLSAILSAGLTGKLDIKKNTIANRVTTSALALGTNPNFLMHSNRDLLTSGKKEKSTTFGSQANISSDSSSKNIFEMLNDKNLSKGVLDSTEIKKIFETQNNVATLAPASNKLVNASVLGGERTLSLNNMPSAPAVVENKISLYEAQYASRLGMAVVEKVRAGQENFDIHLQPESFGKIKVNVNLDFRAMDVKIFTETLAAAAIFKDHENTLQQIMEQNGMKLASFSVGSQNSNDQQRQFANQNKDKMIGKVAGRGNKVITTPNTSQKSSGEQSGLNLIA